MIKVKIIWFSRYIFFLLSLPLLSLVFNHDINFEVSNTIKKETTQRGAWIGFFFFKEWGIAVEDVRRNAFLGAGLWRRLGIVFNENFIPALRYACAQSIASVVSRYTPPNYLPSWRCFIPQPCRHLTLLALLWLRKEISCRHLFWSKCGFFQAVKSF